MDDVLDLMRALRAGRVVAEVTQANLARRAGVTRAMLRRIENGNPEVPVAVLEKVEGALRKLGVALLPRAGDLGRAVVVNDRGFSGQMSALKAGRALAALRQEELAAQAGVSRQMVMRVEKADRSVAASRLQRIRAALERAGVVVLPETDSRGPAVAIRRRE